MVSLTAGVSKLQRLQRLSAEGKSDELRAAITQCTCKELRSFIGLLGVPVRGKDYAIYSNKTGYADLLFQILTRKNVTVTKTRRTKNCNLRLVNVIFGEVLATFVDAMNAEHAQTALTSDQPAENNPFWEKVRAEFIRPLVEYSRVVFQDHRFEGFQLGTPVHHSSEKLWKMWRELCAAYASAAARFEKSGDLESDFSSFCQNRVDVYYLACWLNVKPHLLASVNGKLPQSASLSTQLVAECEDVGEAMESEKSYEGPSKTEQRARLMELIKDACETLKAMREAGLGEEVEEVVRGKLEGYAKQLKSIQEEDAVLR
ncbi:hypothetical protein JG687_00015999 [Phytophthora cactorum]|uniref:Uncharacterized protein n=2 Tax=Phytophthora cactorum TaxID=29920 RepID=A0A329SN67_9STRA|nr:hypothetical protein Pcac1_g8274 [Phytophthora cactorum]KAG2833487.1 hypothetical protein PC112_g6468 [Phytophthora cactorum]KAG2836019.1 hypothetical protein PC111_g5191 [Phytophthora cactorum]KAG2862082.1 hypothetical protein PC113_g6602 [Phytophthora cactorum]KAG2903523.1 hypothetical protein PC114_g12230 [Phytophthora cactorum]